MLNMRQQPSGRLAVRPPACDLHPFSGELMIALEVLFAANNLFWFRDFSLF